MFNLTTKIDNNEFYWTPKGLYKPKVEFKNDKYPGIEITIPIINQKFRTIAKEKTKLNLLFKQRIDTKLLFEKKNY